ncbi:MAG: hypothetical protein JOZ07_05065 [Solirubrobacterales bacterium]|nr:hypothetical protein [Solirubrobacterales bacterium]
MATDEPAPDIDLVAAALRADAGDAATFVESLATKLQAALPGAVDVERRRDGLFGAKRVSRISLRAGDERLELRTRSGSIECSRARLSGGIVLRSETLDTDDWLRALSRALSDQARRNQTTRQALQRLLMS